MLARQAPLSIEIEPMEGQTRDDVALDYTVSQFTENFMLIEIEFIKPYLISMMEEPNVATLTLNDPSKFKRASDNVEIEHDVQLQVVVRR